LHVAVSYTLPTSNGCHLHAAVGHTSPSLACIAISRVVPTSDSCHPHVAVDRVSPSLAHHHQPHGAPEQCPSPAHRRCLHVTVHVAVGCTVPPSDARHPCVAVDHVSPSLARHCWLHGAPKQCLSPAHCRCLCVTVCITIGHMVPLSDACHPHVAVDHVSPSLAHHRRPHGVPKQCLSPARRHCLRITIRVTVGRTVPMSNACHLHVAVAMDVPPPYPT